MSVIVTLKKGEGRTIKAGGAWIFDNEIDTITGRFKNGEVVTVHDFDGYPMGKGFINRNSKIRIRLMTRKKDQEIDDDFLEMLNRKKPNDIEEVENLWYDGNTSRKYEHYDDSRYHALNFHSVFSKGTIEFRMFNGTLHAGEIKTYIQFCLAISHQALVQNKASRVKTHSSNEKYTFRTWLLRLGLIGDEFKTARHHLLKNLDGCIAWKDPQQAVMQRERLQSAQETNNESLEDVQEELGMHMQQM